MKFVIGYTFVVYIKSHKEFDIDFIIFSGLFINRF